MAMDPRQVEAMLRMLAVRYRAARAYARRHGGMVDFPAIVGQVLDEYRITGAEREGYFRELCRRGGRAGGRAPRRRAAYWEDFLRDMSDYFSSKKYPSDVAEGRAPDDPDGLTREEAKAALARDAE